MSAEAGRGDHLRSPEQQLGVCEQAAPTVGGIIVNRDAPPAVDVSGGTMDRADIRTVRERLRDGLTDGVIVAWTDRFSRAPIEEPMAIFREITAAGGHFVVAEMGMDIRPDDPHGETMLVHSLQQARVQYLQIKKRWALSRGNAVRAGRAMGVPPFGYRYVDPTPRRQSRGVVDSRLIPDERYAPVIRELFERKAAGATWLELARWLNTAAPKPDGQRWARSSVATIIRCRTYLGEVRHGANVRHEAHEPLVPAPLWRRAQNEPGRRTPRGTYLLSGLVRCAGCGRNMQGSLRNGTGVYVCRTDGCLAKSSVRTSLLDTESTERFFDRLQSFHVQAVTREQLAASDGEVDRLTGEVERLATIVPTHAAAIAAHQRALTDAERALSEAEDRRDQLAHSHAHDGPDVRELRADWPSLTMSERREILRAAVDAILVRRSSRRGLGADIGERILVLFRGEARAELLNGRGPIISWAWDDDPVSLRPPPEHLRVGGPSSPRHRVDRMGAHRTRRSHSGSA